MHPWAAGIKQNIKIIQSGILFPLSLIQPSMTVLLHNPFGDFALRLEDFVEFKHVLLFFSAF